MAKRRLPRPGEAPSPRIDRRGLLGAGLGGWAGLALLGGQIEAAERNAPPSDAPISLQALDKIKPQEFPWGSLRWIMNAELDPNAQTTLGIVEVKAGQTNPLHVHPNSDEYLHMLSGSCEHRVGKRWVKLRAGDTLRIPQGVKHMARTADEPFRAILVYNTGVRIMTPVADA